MVCVKHITVCKEKVLKR